ncbi:MAG: SIS domain-containing protein [Actinobacteria bacterium]|nr:SIS domain-containing protein [Actinomycetota bacterium]
MKAYRQVFKGMEEILKKIQETQGINIEKAAELIANTIINDGIIHAFGSGHSNLLAEEITFRVGCLAPINHIVDVSVAGTVNVIKSSYLEQLEGIGTAIFNHVRPDPKDIFIVISNSGRNAAPIEVAREAHKNGNKVIALTSITYSKSQLSRHSSGKLLLDYADIILDNCGIIGDICIKHPDMIHGLAPTSTVAGAFILQSVIAQAIFIIKEAGYDPPVLMSGNLDGGMEFNQALIDRYWDRMKNW